MKEAKTHHEQNTCNWNISEMDSYKTMCDNLEQKEISRCRITERNTYFLLCTWLYTNSTKDHIQQKQKQFGAVNIITMQTLCHTIPVAFTATLRNVER